VKNLAAESDKPKDNTYCANCLANGSAIDGTEGVFNFPCRERNAERHHNEY
jgi:hypothetical protein